MENLTYSNYQQFKQVFDTVINRTVEDFIIIGFLLNRAAETNIVNEGGYENVNEFAKAEYGIDATQVSRFVNIYRRFGEPGMPRLKPQYMNHGVAKLGIMLTLPDFLNEEITEDYSKSEINTIKHEYEAEQQVSDIEVTIEHAEMEETVQYSLPQMFTKAVYQLIHDEPALYVRVYDCIELDDMKEILAPMGENSYIVRIKGIGRLTIFLKNAEISIINLRDGSKENYSWQQLFDTFKEYFAMGTDAKDSWSNVFQEPWPDEKKEEPAKPAEKPVEKAKKSDKNNVAKPKKESKVKVVEPRKETVTESHRLDEDDTFKPATNSSQLNEDAAGEPLTDCKQLENVTNCHVLETSTDGRPLKEKEVLKGEVEDIKLSADKITTGTFTDETVVVRNNVQQLQEEIAPVHQNKHMEITANRAMIKTSLKIALDKCDKDDWSSVVERLEDALARARRNKELT